MSIMSKIFTAIRGGTREAGEAIIDKNAIRIFEQEIKDAEQALEKAKRDLTEVMAKEMQAARKVENLTQEIEKHSTYAQQALAKNNEPLALEIAQKIATFETELGIQQKAQSSFAAHSERLKNMIKQAGQGLADLERQLVMVKTTDSVQKATTAISNNYAAGTSKVLSAKDSLDRIKQRQQDLDDRLVAGDQLNDEFSEKELEQKLKEAGIVENDDAKAHDILAKIKAKKTA